MDSYILKKKGNPCYEELKKEIAKLLSQSKKEQPCLVHTGNARNGLDFLLARFLGHVTEEEIPAIFSYCISFPASFPLIAIQISNNEQFVTGYCIVESQATFKL